MSNRDLEQSAGHLPEPARRAIARLRRTEPPADLLMEVVREARRTPQRGGRRGSHQAPAIYPLGAAAAVIIAIVALGRLPAAAPGGSGPSGLPLGGRVELRIPVPDGAHPGSADAQSVWLGDEVTGGVIQLDAATGEIVGRVEVNAPTQDPYDLWPVTDGTSAWVAGRDDRSLVRIDGASMQITARWPIDAVAYRVLPAGDAVWVSDFEGGRILEIDAADGRIRGTVPIGRPTGLALSGQVLWVVDYVGDLYEIDPMARSVVARHDVASRATDVLVHGGDLLIWGIDARPLERFDTAARSVVASQSGITAAALVGGEAWGAWEIGSVVRLDPTTLDFASVVPLGPGTTDQLVASTDRLWAYRGGDDRTYLEAVRPLP